MLGVVRCAGLLQAPLRSPPTLPRALALTATPHKVAAPAAAAREEQPSTVKPVSEVPGPRSFPFVGTIPSMLLDKSFKSTKIHLYFKKMTEMYGPIFKFSQPFNPPTVFVVRPDDTEAVVRATMDNPIRDGFTSFQKIRKEAADNYFENKTGLLTENGEEWWRVRSRVQTPMLRVKELLHYLPLMDQITMEFMDRIASLQSQFGEMPSDFQNELYKWALESVSSVALNRRLGCLDSNITADSEPLRLIRLVNELFHSLNEAEFGVHLWLLFPTPSFTRLKKTHQEFLEIADKNIRETEAALLAKTASDGEDLTLMEALLVKPGLSRKDVVTLILDMLIAGIDTTSHTLAFTLYLLARNPEVQARLQKEVDVVLGNHKGPLTQHHLAQLSYLKAVVKESMRVFPIVLGMGRTLDKDLVLSGYLIPKGWMVAMLGMLMGWDESLFPRAKEFIPERWLRHKPLGPIHPYATLPFGAGTRMCIGRRIAEQEMFTFLARAMQRFTVGYEYEDLELVSRLVFIPSRPLKFTFTQRN
ncbi:probable cytochrome P450 49a1 isoform X1 [Procambarus clarkii]|uniref:probable cytochrome P450 49a1 isoform X1 n=1 Tax=Procambarus clarkii TaxID=6728 RepID=UPI001E67292E|nr:probable cytochrome P450 49a1 [Procambarus clarkii]